MNKLQKIINIFLLAFLLFIFAVLPIVSDARSGCCSHHGGVCGCGCCDGTSLSATCAPYYPQCDGGASDNKGDNGSSLWVWVVLVLGGIATYQYFKK